MGFRLRRLMLLGGGGSDLLAYANKVLSIEPANLIAYYPMWEKSGAIADNYEGTVARDGTYANVTLGQSGIGDGNTCPLFDGTNGYVDIYSASLATAFDGDEGTFMIWFKVFNAGVWTDGAERRINNLEVDGSNRIILRKDSGNNSMSFYHFGGGDNELITNSPYSPTGWVSVALTWSLSSDATKAYYAGSQVGGTQSGLSAWVGALQNGYTFIGADFPAVTRPWHGYLAHCGIWTKELTGAQILELATV